MEKHCAELMIKCIEDEIDNIKALKGFTKKRIDDCNLQTDFDNILLELKATLNRLRVYL